MAEQLPVVAVGAGPASLAFAVALEELAPDELSTRTLMVERHQEVAWQRGMLMPWTESQVSFLKDLVTLRNPRSKFSFVNYLHSTGRLDDFINLGTLTPYRLEISRYLQWVAGALEKVRIEYERPVAAVEPAPAEADGTVTGWLVQFASGDVVRCNDIVLGVGRDPNIPAAFVHLPRERLIHSVNFVQRVADLDRAVAERFVVIGGAQSAAEMMWGIYQSFPAATCTLITRSTGLYTYESSKFVNERYLPSFVDEFFAAQPEVRAQVLREMRRTNYAGLTPSMVDGLFRQIYLDRLAGTERLKIVHLTDVVGCEMVGDEVVFTLFDRLRELTYQVRCDRVLLGTGFRNETPALIRHLADKLGVDRIEVDRNYRMILPDHVAAGCYLQGVNEGTHGIADTLMSILGVRAGEVVKDMLARRSAAAPAAGREPAWAGSAAPVVND